MSDTPNANNAAYGGSPGTTCSASSTAVMQKCCECGISVGMQSMWTNDKGPICQLCWTAQYSGKAATEADYLRDTMAKMEYDHRYTIEAFKAATNTIMSALVRKWEAEGERCGEEGRNSDDAWDADGDEWRERRAVYFECAEELKVALRKFSSQND